MKEMREIDKCFLKIFKDLKITPDKQGNGLLCYIGKQTISSKDVIAMVKEYQDLLVEYLTKDIE